MTQQIINIGTNPGDNTGDLHRDSFDKTNQNFTELYSGFITGHSFIEGGKVSRGGDTFISVSAGSAYLNGEIVNWGSSINLLGLSLDGITNTMFHVYLYKQVNDIINAEISATAPEWDATNKYYRKTGDSTRRWIFTFPVSNANPGVILKFSSVILNNNLIRINFSSDSVVRLFDYLTPSNTGGSPSSVALGEFHISNIIDILLRVEGRIKTGFGGTQRSIYVGLDTINSTSTGANFMGYVVGVITGGGDGDGFRDMIEVTVSGSTLYYMGSTISLEVGMYANGGLYIR